jgi:cation diffusion facilitator CzcD-associated flavoprotein CzcO
MTSLPTTCVIGAGSSGITAVKALAGHGFDVTAYDKSDRVGGNWVWGNTNGMSSAYRSLHINTSRERMEYSDFPMPKSYPDFPHHTHIAKYFDAYVDHFGIRDRIRFETGVEHAARRPDGVWEVSLDDGSTHRYDALLVANGHHWDPRWPEPAFPGSEDFEGVQMHSHDYKGDDPDLFRDKTVVVLGMGNSAMDIAVESSFVAKNTYLAARRGAYVIPKYLFGKPADQHAASPKIPFEIRRRVVQQMLKIAVGEMERYGLPKPDHRFGDAHPTVSDDILSRMAHGEIAAKPNIASLTRNTVRFVDGSEVEADIVVYCTGYKVTFPFFGEGFIAAPDNDLPLFRRTFHPDIPNVFFVGLMQPWGAIMPIAEAQGEWISDHLSGRYALPAPADLRADMEDERRRMFKRYVASKRHTMQVDYDDWMAALAKERKAGAERARLRGYALPVPPLAGAPVAA